MRRGTLHGLLAAGVAAFVAGASSVSRVAFQGTLWPDAVEYVAIANSWVNGAGFVDPVKWTFYLDTGSPFPAFALRSPVPSVLFALPLSLGLGVQAVAALHAVLASLVVGGMVLLAHRMMGGAAALACGLLVGLSTAWLVVADMPASDVLAIGAMLLVFAASARVADSVPAALTCAALTLLGWATRPTVVLVAIPIVVNVAWSAGLRGAWRSRGLRAYLGALLGGYVTLHVLTLALIGHAPYAGYGFMSQMISVTEPLHYRKQYPGTVQYVVTRWVWIEAIFVRRLVEVWRNLFVWPLHAYVGWIAAPGLLYVLAVRDHDPERSWLRRLVALAGLLFTAQTILNYAAFDRYRYVLPTVVCGALCGFALLDDLLLAAGRRLGAASPQAGSARGAARRLVPVLLGAVPLLFVVVLHRGAWLSLPWNTLRAGAVLAGAVPDRRAEWSAPEIRSLCRHVRPGVVVASADPWQVHGWCGNPGITLPIDLSGRPQLQDAFFRKEKPAYVLADPSHEQAAWLVGSLHVRALARADKLALFEVLTLGERRRTWRQPPPLMCAGFAGGCSLALAAK